MNVVVSSMSGLRAGGELVLEFTHLARLAAFNRYQFPPSKSAKHELSDNEFFRGEIDEYGYWTSALSGDNIEWLSQNSLATVIPEPSTLTLAALGLLALLGFTRRRRK